MCMILSAQRHNGGGRRRRSEADQECHRSGPGRDGEDRAHDARRRVGYEQISGRHVMTYRQHPSPLCVFLSALVLLLNILTATGKHNKIQVYWKLKAKADGNFI